MANNNKTIRDRWEDKGSEQAEHEKQVMEEALEGVQKAIPNAADTDKLIIHKNTNR